MFFCSPARFFCYPERFLCYPERFLRYPERVFCYPERVLRYPEKVLRYPEHHFPASNRFQTARINQNNRFIRPRFEGFWVVAEDIDE